MSIYEQTYEAAKELVTLQREFFRPVKLLVVGCSSSEIAGGTIGKNSTYELGEEAVRAIIDLSKEMGFDCAFQCCEHLNRSLVVSGETMEKYGLEQVCVVPQIKAGGSCATAAYSLLERAVVVDSVKADAGIDIGLTMIGMHLKRTAVPIRLQHNKIGEALVTAARTRPMLIGGERAVYR